LADSGGYWSTLAEAQKLTESILVPGVIEEQIRRGSLVAQLPVMQVKGQSVKWNRENAERLGKSTSIGTQLTWSDNITYTQKEISLEKVYDQTPLDHYVEEVYGSINNYRAVILRGLRKGVLRKLDDLATYGDATYGTNEPDGIHAWAEDNGNTHSGLDVDEGEGALSLNNMRSVEDEMRYGIDYWLMPPEIMRRINAFYQEGESGATDRQRLGNFMWSRNDAGVPISFFNGVPIVKTDYLVAEQANTGVGSDARAKNSSGTNQYSIFAIKAGQIAENEPGMTVVFGGERHNLGEFLRLVDFPDLEDFDAEGLRVVSYFALASASARSVGRIYDITDALPTA
jgi:hypothetical protein